MEIPRREEWLTSSHASLTSDTAPSTREPPREERIETLRLVGDSGDFCAAVAIATRLAVTAMHCVRAFCTEALQQNTLPLIGCRIRYELPNGRSSLATVVAISDIDLVALLDLHRPQVKYGSLRCDDPHAKDPVYTVGHPGGQNWSMLYGNLSQDPIALEWVSGQTTRVLVADIPTKRGSSGGGLFDIRDNVVGIQIARFAPWSTEFGKAAFIQANRVFSMAGRFCVEARASACVGLRCESDHFDIWGFSKP
jgi:S1-C subfamily serine protease